MYADLVNTGEISVLERVIGFTEARHKLLANNIANIDTPQFKVKDLDVVAFRRDLQGAIADQRAGRNDGGRLNSGQVDFDQYLLFHDGNNRSIEKQMSALTRNAILHNVAVELLKNQYDQLERAVSLKF